MSSLALTRPAALPQLPSSYSYSPHNSYVVLAPISRNSPLLATLHLPSLSHSHSSSHLHSRFSSSASAYSYSSLTSASPKASLPPEIWRTILRFSTLEPSSRLGMDSLARHVPQDRLVVQEYISECRRTKRAIMGVCAAWRMLAREFNWESVYIGNGDGLSSVEEGLGRDGEAPLIPPPPTASKEIVKLAHQAEKRSIKGRTTNGWWTKSLEIQLSGPLLSAPQTLRILHLVPNLRTLIVCCSLDISASPSPNQAQTPGLELLSILAESHCVATLRRLEWNLPASEKAMTRLLHRASRLEYLVLSLPPTPKGLDSDAQDGIEGRLVHHPNDPISLPKLHYLELDGLFQNVIDLCSWSLPSLLSLTVRFMPGLHTPSLLHFLDTHTPHLRSLVVIDRPGLLSSSQWTSLLHHTPCLHNLTFNLLMTRPFSTLHPHPSLTHMGIMGLLPSLSTESDPDQFKEYWDDLEEHLKVLEDPTVFPNLKIVRTIVVDADEFRERLECWSFELVLMWRKWVERFAQRGIRLEDRNGQLLRVSTSEEDLSVDFADQ